MPDIKAYLDKLTPVEREALSKATYRDLHPLIVQDAAAGRWNALQFFDSIPWTRGGGDWTPWRAFLCALYALPMDAQQLAIYKAATGRKRPPRKRATEAWLVVGRRGRKSAVAAVLAAYTAAYRDHSKYTAPGEVARIPILSRAKSEAQQIKRYVDSIFSAPALRWMVQGPQSAEVVRIQHDPKHPGCEISIRAATIMAGRSFATPLAVLDELAFFRADESANPDVEIIRSITPGMATVPDPLLLGLSSPYARRGVLWAKYREHWGQSGDILVWKAPTLVMFPGNQRVAEYVAQEYKADPVSAAAEYGAEFRTDIEQFVSDEVVEGCTDDVESRLPVPGVQYVAFADPSGGTSDSMTLAIGHWEPPSGEHVGRAVLDLVMESPAPFDPGDVIREHAAVLRLYGVSLVEGDRYAGEWPAMRYREAEIMDEGGRRIKYVVRYATSEMIKSELYRHLLPLMTSGVARLLKSPRLKAQLTGLDRFRSRSGRDSIDHQPGGHDDVANAVAGVLVRADRLRVRAKEVAKAEPVSTWEILIKDLEEGVEREKAGKVGGVYRWRRRERL
jgi:hypothetical protein